VSLSELQDGFIDGHIDELVFCDSLGEMGLSPGEVSEHLEQARNWRIMAALNSEWGHTKHGQTESVINSGQQIAA